MANLKNLQAAQIDGASIIDNLDGHAAIRMRSGKVLAIDTDPNRVDDPTFTPQSAGAPDPRERNFVELDEATLPATRSIRATCRLDALTVEVQSDSRLSPAGVIARLREPRVTTLQVIAQALQALDDIARELDAREHDLYEPEARDQVGELRDAESRAWFNALPPAMRSAWLTKTSARDRDADFLLAALRRAPTPLADDAALIVGQAWNDAVATREPQRAKDLATARENHAWALRAAEVCARAAVEISTLLPAEVWNAVRSWPSQFERFRLDRGYAESGYYERQLAGTASQARAAA